MGHPEKVIDYGYRAIHILGLSGLFDVCALAMRRFQCRTGRRRNRRKRRWRQGGSVTRMGHAIVARLRQIS